MLTGYKGISFFFCDHFSRVDLLTTPQLQDQTLLSHYCSCRYYKITLWIDYSLYLLYIQLVPDRFLIPVPAPISKPGHSCSRPRRRKCHYSYQLSSSVSSYASHPFHRQYLLYHTTCILSYPILSIVIYVPVYLSTS